MGLLKNLNNMSVPTAEDFKKYSGFIEETDRLIEFAKLHVDAAIKSIYNVGVNDVTEWSGNPYTGEGSYYLCLEQLEKQYPLDNIK